MMDNFFVGLSISTSSVQKINRIIKRNTKSKINYCWDVPMLIYLAEDINKKS